MTSGPADLILSILMLAAILLGAGGVWLLRKGRDRRRAILMLVAAAVMLFNVLIWAVPVKAGAALPRDVSQFVAKRDSCDHWRGEPGTDDKRDRAIERAVRRTCTGTDRALAALRRKYADDAAIVKTLSNYETTVE